MRLNKQADKIKIHFHLGIQKSFFFKMTEWLQSKWSERFHSIMKEPQTTACGCDNLG